MKYVNRSNGATGSEWQFPLSAVNTGFPHLDYYKTLWKLGLKGFPRQGWQHTTSPENLLLPLAIPSMTLSVCSFEALQTPSRISNGFKNNKCLTPTTKSLVGTAACRKPCVCNYSMEQCSLRRMKGSAEPVRITAGGWEG